ncbi:hypothetical protein [Kibdelosporangium aridum]|uniref:hypothetical protein n=1 Tax=Kibdelosporangium aridum TaxID=2030 RepID=UPI0035EAD1F6
MSTLKDRWATIVLAIATALAAANVGQILLTHAHYQSWQHISPHDMTAVHDNWASVVDTVIMPLAIASAACTLTTLVLRHSRVPWWTVGTAAAIHAAVFITSFTMWAKWQHQIGNRGYVRDTDNTFSVPYERIMDTHWLRITLMTILALVTLAMLLRATTRKTHA